MLRSAGVVLPLFSMRTRRDWGIGQITDLPACARWVARSGHRLLQVLPPHELSPGETSPYSALTAFALDPVYAGIEGIVDLDEALLARTLGDEGHATLERLRRAERVDYRGVRAMKTRALGVAFQRFLEREWSQGTERASRLQAFMRDEASWLSDFALYSAVRASHDGWGWSTWPEGERDRHPERLDALRRGLDARVLEVAYVQWTLLEQWTAARAAMLAEGVELMGDLPFVVCEESADVWARPREFQLSMSLGAPPDDFSADGQEWGLPPYDWSAMDASQLAWLRARIRHAARLYDRFRLDHVVGYFRQWVRPKGAKGGAFDPEGDAAQLSRGQRILSSMIDVLGEPASTGSSIRAPRIIAEDLGVIPPFVREALRAMGMPGYRVLPWEKDGAVVRDPGAFPPSSVATWSTHDTPPITAWWPDLPEQDRAVIAKRAGVAQGADDAALSLSLLADLYASGSDLTLVLAQELLGERDRLNTPATVNETNWTWRLRRPIEELEDDGRVAARMAAIRTMVERSGRLPDAPR